MRLLLVDRVYDYSFYSIVSTSNDYLGDMNGDNRYTSDWFS